MLIPARSWASRSHIHHLSDNPNYNITALQNSSKPSAEAAAKQYNLSSVSTHDNPKDLAEDPNVDIVAVSVNVPEHYNLIKPALEAGKSVFAEWPLARNLNEAAELTELAKSKNLKTMVGLQARQSPAIIKAKEFVESGKLGKILGTTMFGHGMVFGPTIAKDFLYALPVEAGANILTIPFGHAVDALCFVLGELDSLSATLSNHRPELTVMDGDKEVGKVKKTAHDYVSITGTLLSGGNVDVTYVGGTSITGRNFYWEIVGTDGSLVLEAPMGHIQMFEPTLKYVGSADKSAAGGKGSGGLSQSAPQELEVVDTEKSDGWQKGNFSFNVGRAWDAFAGVEEVLRKGHTVTTFEDALNRHKMIEAIYRSAEKGTREKYL
jgi:predicted dehydrogenase